MAIDSLAQRIQEHFGVSDVRIIHNGNNVVASAVWSDDQLPGLERILIKLSNYGEGRKDPYYEIAAMGNVSKEDSLPDGTPYEFRIPRPIMASTPQKTWKVDMPISQIFSWLRNPLESEFDTILIMEELKGQSLNHVIPGKLTPSQIAQVAQDVYAPLVISHHRGIVHRDVKPSNIIGTIEDEHIRATLVDYGMEERIDRAKNSIAAKRFVGTPRYMATWLDDLDINNDAVAKTLDYVGLAATLSYLALGKVLPFDKEDKSFPDQSISQLKTQWDQYVDNADASEKEAARTLRDFVHACFNGPNPSIAQDENAYQIWLPKFQEAAANAPLANFSLDYAQEIDYIGPENNCSDHTNNGEVIPSVQYIGKATIGDPLDHLSNDSPTVADSVRLDNVMYSQTIPDGYCEE